MTIVPNSPASFAFAAKTSCVLALAVSVVLLSPAHLQSDSHASFIPHFRPGQILQYKVVARINRHTKTESNVMSPSPADNVESQIATNLQLTVRESHLENGQPVLALHAELESEAPSTPSTLSTPSPSSPPAKGKLDFTVGSNGRIAKPEGIEDLDPQQRVAWQFWASQFAYAWTLPPQGVTVGEKWKTAEPEDTPTAIANLVWERETTYVRNDKCPIIPSETCAIFLTHAKLKQKSSEEDATPDAYRLHNLKTSGTATGTNEAIRYISLKTHLILRAKEDAQQSMDATVAKTDDSNQVRYFISSSSQFETTLIPAAANPATH
ncbi:MAG: hypothetical protein WCE52_10825 [Candidatus Acidiferrum sp.]